MTQKREDNESYEGLVCDRDPKCTADLLIRKHEGLLSEAQDEELEAHLAACDECRSDYESLKDFDMDMLIAANDDAQLRRFRPAFEHAETCLVTSWDRLERFAKGKSEDPFVSDDELEEHIDACVYCRRRSIIAHRRAQYCDHLPLAYRLSESAVDDALTTAYERCCEVVFPPPPPPERLDSRKPRGAVPIRVRGVVDSEASSLIKAKSAGQVKLATGETIRVRLVPERVLSIELENLPDADGRRVLLISPEQTEKDNTLNADGRVQFVDLPDGEYYLRIEGIATGLLLALRKKSVDIRVPKSD